MKPTHNLNHAEQLRKLQETIKKNQIFTTKSFEDLKPEDEDPLQIKELKENFNSSEFV